MTHLDTAVADVPAPARAASFARARRAGLGLWRFIIGVVLCQAALGAMVAVGWTYRSMQRSALRHWWRRSAPERRGEDFATFALGDAMTATHAHAPAWFAARTASGHADGSRLRMWVRRGLGSLWLNLRTGLGAVANTLVLTGPAAALWVFSWHAGWDNSFNKGYEQAFVGPLTGFGGVGLFIAAMLYVPMAQVRQAVSGNWRVFYDFRLNWRLMRACWVSMLLLAGLYVLVSVPVHTVRVFPYFMHVANPTFGDMSAMQQIDVMNRYYVLTTAATLALFVLVRLVATRIYAAGVIRALRHNRIRSSQLSPFERHALARLALDVPAPSPDRHVLVQAVVDGSTRAARMGSMVALAAVWFAFTAQIFVAQFFNYQPVRAWVNQPLVHAPWVKFIPNRLQNAAGAETRR